MPTFGPSYYGPTLAAGVAGSMANYETSGVVSNYAGYDAGGLSDYCMTALAYVPNGKAVPVQYLVALTASADGAPGLSPIPPDDDAYDVTRLITNNWTAIPPTAITMAGGQLGSDGIYYRGVRSGAPIVRHHAAY